MAEKGFAKRFLETKWFGLVIGLVVFGLLAGLTWGTNIIRNIETKVLDFNFRMKNPRLSTRIQEGVTVEEIDPRISSDILIVGIDERALARFGRWPFPRWRHADLIDSLADITDQAQRERALFLDIFFNEPDTKNPQDDATVVASIAASGRVFLENVLQRDEFPAPEGAGPFERNRILEENFGAITDVTGDWKQVEVFYGLKPPLVPYARASRGYGHANFVQDEDQVYRRAALVTRASELVEEIDLDDLSPETVFGLGRLERLSWRDKHNIEHDIAAPHVEPTAKNYEAKIEKARAKYAADFERTVREAIRRAAPPATEEDSDGDGTVDRVTYTVRRWRDTIMPAITLSLAAEHFNVSLADVEVALGDRIRLPRPRQWNVETAAWEPYVNPRGEKPDAIEIPIDAAGRMMINFMGYPSSSSASAASTYPVRSYARYASNPPGADPATWDESQGLANKIVMVGAFSQGMAEDQKPTPFGLMFGVEIHANALNTILKENHLLYAPWWLSLLILFAMTMATAFITGRLSTVWSLVLLVVVLVVYFGVVLVLFDFTSRILMLSAPLLGAFLTFLGVVAYRTVFEEKDKRKNKAIFSKIVGPAVLDQILDHPPELGGQDKELTVFFSDIRSFSSISEKMASQDLLSYLNNYLSQMADIVKDYNGTLDKYIGDAVMAFWGAPIEQEEPALLACKCALKQMDALAVINEGLRATGKEIIDIGIGISTGIMTVGFMGSAERLNYTVIGDAVNLGSRLEGMNKMYYQKDPDPKKNADHFSRIIISDNTYEKVKDKVVTRELDVVRVKGKQEPEVIHELIDIVGGYEPPKPPPSKGKMLAAAAEADRRARADKAKVAEREARRAAKVR